VNAEGNLAQSKRVRGKGVTARVRGWEGGRQGGDGRVALHPQLVSTGVNVLRLGPQAAQPGGLGGAGNRWRPQL
jgi:hypothetical protein